MRKAINHLKKADPVMAAIISKAGPYRMQYREPVFQTLVRSIVYQQLSGKAALTIFNRLAAAAKVNPMTPEAIALHYLDNLDAKVHTFARDIREDRNQAATWTPFNPSLQRRLFKGSVEGAEPVYSSTLDGSE